MKKINENDTPSRGESSLDVKLDFENSLPKSENISENSTSESGLGGSYSAKNPELEAMLNEETTTKEQHKTNEREQIKASKAKISVEQAMDISITGLNGLVKMASEYSGNQIQITQSAAMMFATLTAPLIQKYGSKFSLDPNNIDLDSWMPEVMALGGVAIVGYPMFKQMSDKKIKEVKPKEPESHGDKPEPSA